MPIEGEPNQALPDDQPWAEILRSESHRPAHGALLESFGVWRHDMFSASFKRYVRERKLETPGTLYVYLLGRLDDPNFADELSAANLEEFDRHFLYNLVTEVNPKLTAEQRAALQLMLIGQRMAD